MLNAQTFSDLQLVAQFLFENLFARLWLLISSTILSFIVIAWVFAHIIKFFKRLL